MPSPQDPADAIARLIASEDAAWIAGDAEAFSRHVADDVVFTNIFGTTFVGRAGFVAQHAHIFSTIYKGSKLRQEIQHLRFVRPDVAIVNSETVVSEIADPPPEIQAAGGVLRTRMCQVLVEEDGDWWITSFHNVPVRTPPGAAVAK